MVTQLWGLVALFPFNDILQVAVRRVFSGILAANREVLLHQYEAYLLGLAVLRLGFEYLASMELTEHGRPVIEDLRDLCGYSAHVVVRDNRDVVFVAKAAGRDPLDVVKET